MRGAFVGIVGAAAIALLVAGLVEHDLRAGPFDRPLAPVSLDVLAEGTYHARPATAPVLGLCPSPCAPETTLDVRLDGLPPGTYAARLEGGGSRQAVPLEADGAAHRIEWTAPEDHTDKSRLVVALAGRDILSVPVHASAEPVQVRQVVGASWQAAPAEVRLNEIGGVEISSVAKARLAETPPAGHVFHGHFEGAGGRIDLGILQATASGSLLDARVERVPLEHQQRLVIELRADPSVEGFPVLQATVGASA